MLFRSEHELSDIYRVSRPTIRKAVQILVDAGYLEKKKKRGTIVCIPKVIQDFTQTISSFDTQMKRHGIVSQTQVISFKKEQASKEIADSLHQQEEDLVYKLVRLRYTDKNPNGSKWASTWLCSNRWDTTMWKATCGTSIPTELLNVKVLICRTLL